MSVTRSTPNMSENDTVISII